MPLQLSGNGVVSGLDSLASSDLGTVFGSKLDLAGGKILQIVRATDSTNRTTTSSSFVDVTGLSVTITPQKSDSVLLLIGSIRADNNAAAGTSLFQITDSSNTALSGAEAGNVGTGNGAIGVMVTLIGRATPGVTTAVTYKVRFSGNVGQTTSAQNATNTGQLYAIEVSA